MQSFCNELCSLTTSTTPTPSRSVSRSSGRHTHDRGRSGGSPRHRHEARQSHRMRYSRSSGSRRGSGHHDGHHSPSLNNYDTLSRRVRTDPVDRSRPKQHEQPRYAPTQTPTRRSTLPSYPEKAKLRSSRHTETHRLGFDPLANRQAYQGVDTMVKTRGPRAEDRGRSSRRRGTKAVQTSTRFVATATDRDYWVNVKKDARKKPFKKLNDEFWDTQLTKKEQRAAIETFENDFKSGYDVNLHPYLKGVIPSLSEAQLTEVVKVKWTSIDAFRRRIHPHLVDSIYKWKQILEDVTDGDENIGRYLAANHMTEDQLSQAQQACDEAGRPFWEMAAMEHKQELKSRVNSMGAGRKHDSLRDRQAREMRLIKALQEEFETELDPPRP